VKDGRVRNPRNAAILSELLELNQLGLVNSGPTMVISLVDVDPAAISLQVYGAHLFNLMKLYNIPNEDLMPIKAELTD
jgi:hypothetical protein